MNLQELQERNKSVKYPYSLSSLKKLVGVLPIMQEFMFNIANVVDNKIVYGVRSDPEQFSLYAAGKSTFDGKIKKSDHQPKDDGYGYAVDSLPLPKGVNMYLDDGNEDNIRWAQFDGLCHGIAHMMGIKVITGFKWRSTMMESLERPERDNTLPDGNHVAFAGYV